MPDACIDVERGAIAVVHCGDMRDVLASMRCESVDAIVTDPPYGLEFMAAQWDQQVPGPDYWRECLRVARPGAHLVACGGTRTAHRLACAIEDAGWEIRDCLSWLYGSGFPKSHNLDGDWRGWGTALKPAWEPIYLARRPFKCSVASNVVEHGCGGLNIDGCRIGRATDDVSGWSQSGSKASENGSMSGANYARDPKPDNEGRWPANLVLDEIAAAMLDAQTGVLKSGALSAGHKQGRGSTSYDCVGDGKVIARDYGNDAGGASRFFYTAKAPRAEREAGLERFESRNVNDGRDTSIDNPYQRGDTQRRNTHPTVKPVSLMRWLVRLVTPLGGVVLDPFTGSGSTGVAVVLEGIRFIGVELSPEFAALARARISHAADEDDGDQLTLFDRSELKPAAPIRRQLSIFDLGEE